MSKIPILPLDVNDLIADTTQLTNEEFGAYCRFLFGSWQQGGKVAADETAIRRMCHADRRWNQLKPMLLHYVIWGTDFVHQKRLLATHESVQAKIGQTINAANTRWSKNNKTTNADADADADAKPMRSRARVSEQDEQAPLSEACSDSPLPPSTPNETEPSVARDLGLTPSGSQGSSQPTRMVNDWDLSPISAPSGQTPFLKKYAAYKAGDEHALDPHPDLPNKAVETNPQLTAKIRQQLGLDYSHAEAPPDTYDDGLLRRPQQSPDPAGHETTPATEGNDQALPAPTHPGTWHADPGNTGEEGPEMKWDDDDDDSYLFKRLF